MAQLSQSEAFTIHYFGVRGAASVATIVLEQGGVGYKVKKYSFEEWAEFKPKSPTGFLPLIEYADGTFVGESGAISRVAAAQAGLLGEGRDFGRSEMLIGMLADTMKIAGGNVPTMMTVGNWSPEKTEAYNKEYKPKIKASLERLPKLLLEGADRFTTNGNLLGELDLWFRLFQLVNGPYGDLFTDIPGLKPFYDRVSKLQGPKNFDENKTQFGEIPNYFVPLP